MFGSGYVVCRRNAGYEASLDRGARYRLLPDEEAARYGQVRIVDESGERYNRKLWIGGVRQVAYPST